MIHSVSHQKKKKIKPKAAAAFCAGSKPQRKEPSALWCSAADWTFAHAGLVRAIIFAERENREDAMSHAWCPVTALST